MNASLDILCVSDMCVDLVLSGNVRPQFNQIEQLMRDYTLEIGGSANIFASQFVKLGGRAGVIGFIGEDAFGKTLLEKLKKIGVDVSRVCIHKTLKTGLTVSLAEQNDRAILTYPGTIDAVRISDLTSASLKSCRHWHIASYFLLNQFRPHWSKWLSRCRKMGITTSLDTNWDPENRWQGVKELLPLVDVFLPNETEALAIADESNVEKAGKKLASYGPLVVIKRGEKGAVAFQKNYRYQMMPQPTKGSLQIIDTIGAGDNFDAGFLRAWLQKQDIPECLSLGCRCARASLSKPGGIEGQLQKVIRYRKSSSSRYNYP